MLKDSLMNKVVGLYFGQIQFLVFFMLYFYVMQDCSSHVDRLLGNFCRKLESSIWVWLVMVRSLIPYLAFIVLTSWDKFGSVLVLMLQVVVDITKTGTWNSKLMDTEAIRHALQCKAWWIPLNFHHCIYNFWQAYCSFQCLAALLRLSKRYFSHLSLRLKLAILSTYE